MLRRAEAQALRERRLKMADRDAAHGNRRPDDIIVVNAIIDLKPPVAARKKHAQSTSTRRT